VTFEGVETGLRRDRSQLALALAECRLRCAVLLIDKLDRLARRSLPAWSGGGPEPGRCVACPNRRHSLETPAGD
jgi:hypothetical protein